jgi:hypothetical protein
MSEGQQLTGETATHLRVMSDSQPEKDREVTFKKPTTPLELLQNVKLAFDHGLLLREDFYSDENLKAFSGGAKVRRSVGGPNAGPRDLFCEVTEFGSMVAPRKVGNFVISGIALSLRRRILEDGRVSGSVSLSFQQSVPTLSFEAVTELFGSDWASSKEMISPHLVLQPPTKPHGNARIEYIVGDARSELSFDPNALLSSAVIVLHGESK